MKRYCTCDFNKDAKGKQRRVKMCNTPLEPRSSRTGGGRPSGYEGGYCPRCEEESTGATEGYCQNLYCKVCAKRVRV